jgi:hypothetical protein
MNTNLSLIREKGFDALTRELGSVATVRFIKQFDNGHGDYTKDREALLHDVTVDDIAARILARKQQNSNPTR